MKKFSRRYKWHGSMSAADLEVNSPPVSRGIYLGGQHVFSREETRKLANAIAVMCEIGDCITLQGNLGAGKTAFIKSFAAALGRDEQEVTSPTFTLAQPYEVSLSSNISMTMWHFDLYRLRNAEELRELGIEDALSNGIVLIEWPQLALNSLPDRRLDIRMEWGSTEEARRFEFYGDISWKVRLEKINLVKD